MIACVTDLDGRITGVHRTWLDPDVFDRIRLGKAPIEKAIGTHPASKAAATAIRTSPAASPRPVVG